MLGIEEVVMPASSACPRWFPALAAGALSAALAFVLVRPGAPEAGGGDDLPATVAGDVRLYGELKPAGDRWVVLVRAVNGAAAPRRCKVSVTLSELRDSPMSRVVRAPRTLWTTDLALGLTAQGSAEGRAFVPAKVAARLGGASKAARPRQVEARRLVATDEPRTLEPRETVTHPVSLQASCTADDEVVG